MLKGRRVKTGSINSNYFLGKHAFIAIAVLNNSETTIKKSTKVFTGLIGVLISVKFVAGTGPVF
jgi:hypothetical protein